MAIGIGANAIIAPHEDEEAAAASFTGGGGALGGTLAPTAAVQPNIVRSAATYNMNDPNLPRPGNSSGTSDDGGGYVPGKSTGPAPKVPSPTGTTFDDGPHYNKPAPVDAAPPPAATPAPPPTIGAGNQASEKEDEELQHGGFAQNILAGGMFEAPPQLARNILLGN